MRMFRFSENIHVLSTNDFCLRICVRTQPMAFPFFQMIANKIGPAVPQTPQIRLLFLVRVPLEQFSKREKQKIKKCVPTMQARMDCVRAVALERQRRLEIIPKQDGFREPPFS